VSFAAIIVCVASQRVFIVVVHFVIDSVQKLLDTPWYVTHEQKKSRGIQRGQFQGSCGRIVTPDKQNSKILAAYGSTNCGVKKHIARENFILCTEFFTVSELRLRIYT
jgi:hypothetical protein